MRSRSAFRAGLLMRSRSSLRSRYLSSAPLTPPSCLRSPACSVGWVLFLDMDFVKQFAGGMDRGQRGLLRGRRGVERVGDDFLREAVFIGEAVFLEGNLIGVRDRVAARGPKQSVRHFGLRQRPQIEGAKVGGCFAFGEQADELAKRLRAERVDDLAARSEARQRRQHGERLLPAFLLLWRAHLGEQLLPLIDHDDQLKGQRLCDRIEHPA